MKDNIRVIAFLLVLRWIENKQAKLDKFMAEYGVVETLD